MPEATSDNELDELADHLARSSRLSKNEARRLIDDVLHFCGELPDEYVRRRHWALQTHGMSNDAIFMQLTSELRARRFRAPDYSTRQLRRIVYG